LDCVEKVKLNIADRKRIAASQNQSSKKSERFRVSGQHVVSGALAKPTVSLNDFTVIDRRKVIDLLLSSDQVLQFLYDKLFPPAADPVGLHQELEEF